MTNKIVNSLRTALLDSGATNVVIGLSGGVDSVVLTHALSFIEGIKVTCLHVNHGISDNAQDWERHCELTASEFGYGFAVKRAELKGVANLESVARDLRYDFFSEYVDSKTALLTAHHLNDQAETFMLRLMRGSGVDGLSAMRPSRDFGEGLMLRPLLDFTKDELIQYAKSHNLEWVEDESNDDSKYDRNFIRNEVMPLLESRWKSAPRSIAKAASHMQSANVHIQEKAVSLVKWNVLNNKVRLDERYKALDAESKALLIREWMQQNNLKAINLSRLNHFIARVDEIKSMDNQLSVDVSEGVKIIHYNGMLHIVHEAETLSVEFKEQGSDEVDCGINLPVGELVRIPYSGSDMFYVDKCHRQLRRFLKEMKVPVWEREKYPVYAYKGEVVLVGSYVSDTYQSFLGVIPVLKRDL